MNIRMPNLGPLNLRSRNIGALVDRLDPSHYVTFRSTHHDKRNAAILGASLGIAFFICFFTGLISHSMQHQVSWFPWPSWPTNFYRFTQGLHVVTGLACIPLLLAKLWVVFPKLLEWPPVTGFAKTLERLSLLPLIGGGLFQLITGTANISQWYFFKFFFTYAHYSMAWITIGALVVHMGAKWHITRTELFSRSDGATTASHVDPSRRAFLTGIFGTAGIITFFTAGQSFSPLGRFALLAPRRPGVGVQHLPVNATAKEANVIDRLHDPAYKLVIGGRVAQPMQFTLAQLQALTQHESTLPITCVEGWSASGHWRGVRVKDLLQMVGAPKGASVLVQSLQEHGLYGESVLNPSHAHDSETLLALELNGETLHVDHGYPCRLIAPNRPGVLQTKWVHKLTVV